MKKSFGIVLSLIMLLILAACGTDVSEGQKESVDPAAVHSEGNQGTVQEPDDPDSRPAISGSVDNMDQYAAIVIGYPIWHGQTPRIISTFLESYDFTGKTIVPFCTSHSSGIGSSANNLHALKF